jgi:hypothetical protein
VELYTAAPCIAAVGGVSRPGGAASAGEFKPAGRRAGADHRASRCTIVRESWVLDGSHEGAIADPHAFDTAVIERQARRRCTPGSFPAVPMAHSGALQPPLGRLQAAAA